MKCEDVLIKLRSKVVSNAITSASSAVGDYRVL